MFKKLFTKYTRILLILSSIFLTIYNCIQYRELKSFATILSLIIISLFLIFVFYIINKKNIKYIIYVIPLLIFVIALLNVKYFVKEAHISEDYYSKEAEYSSLIEYFINNYSEDDKISSSFFGVIAEYIKVDMLEGKEVILSECAVNNYGIKNYLDEELALYKPKKTNILPISNIQAQEYKNLYNPQIIEIKDVDTREVLSSIYLVTGSVWMSCEKIYILSSVGGETWIIPSKLAKIEIIDEDIPLVNQDPELKDFIANLNFHDDGFIESLKNSDGVIKEEVKNFLFLVYLTLIGIISLFFIRKNLGIKLYITIALPVGVCIYIIASTLGGFMKIPLNIISTTVVSFLMSFTILAISNRLIKKNTQNEHKESIWGILTYAFILFGGYIYFCIFHYTYLLYDSLRNIMLGHRIATSGNITNMLESITSYSLFSPIIHMGAKLFNIEYNYSFQPVFSYVCILAIFWIQIKILNNINKNHKILNGMISLLSIICYITTPVFRLNAIWILNNLPVGLLIGLGVGLIILYYQENNLCYLFLSMLPFFMYAHIRIEGIIFAAILLVCAKKIFTQKVNIYYTGIIVASSIFVFLMYCLHIGNVNSVFWTPLKGGAMQIVIVGYFIYLLISNCLLFRNTKWCRNLDHYLYHVMLLVLSTVIIVLGFIRSETAISNIKMLLKSTFSSGYFGGLWIIVLLLMGLGVSSLDKEEKIIKFLEKGIASYVLLLFALMLFRENKLHAGYGDSAHRMILHMIPITGMYIAIKFSLLMEQVNINIIISKIYNGIFSITWGFLKYLPFPGIKYLRFFLLKIFTNEIYSVELADGITIRDPWNISVGHKTFLYHNVTINGNGGVRIGNGVKILNNTTINAGGFLSYDTEIEVSKNTDVSVIIEDNVQIGIGVIINSGVKIGRNSIISAGMVIKEDISPNTTL